MAWRRRIHRQPELGFAVHRTAELVARTLRDLGAEVQTGVGQSGVVGLLGEGPGPVIAIRADMDALPIHEANAVAYASEIPGAMHACGHDAHTAMLLGAATLLAQQALPGQIRLLFQPSEESFDAEGLSGASRMIADGALTGVQGVIALHVDGTLDTGQIRVGAGYVTGAVDDFKARITGRGGHRANPHLALDPIWLTSQVLPALYAIPSRRSHPFKPCVITVGVIQGGSATNIIPEAVSIEGTLRSMHADLREQLIADVDRALSAVRAWGGDYALTITRGYPSLYNDPDVVRVLTQTAQDLLGSGGLAEERPTLGAEDFSYMAQQAPGAMLMLGVKAPHGEPRYLHTPNFDIDENALPVGAALLAEAALRLLRAAA